MRTALPVSGYQWDQLIFRIIDQYILMDHQSLLISLHDTRANPSVCGLVLTPPQRLPSPSRPAVSLNHSVYGANSLRDLANFGLRPRMITPNLPPIQQFRIAKRSNERPRLFECFNQIEPKGSLTVVKLIRIWDTQIEKTVEKFNPIQM